MGTHVSVEQGAHAQLRHILRSRCFEPLAGRFERDFRVPLNASRELSLREARNPSQQGIIVSTGPAHGAIFLTTKLPAFTVKPHLQVAHVTMALSAWLRAFGATSQPHLRPYVVRRPRCRQLVPDA